MSSDIQAIPNAGKGAGAPALPKKAASAAPAAAHPAAKPEVVVRPKLEVPKSPEINFDPNKARENLSTAISMLNKQMESTKRGLGFSYDESKKTAVIKVTDVNSGEVIRQIPTEAILKMAHHIDAVKGTLYNKIA
jgi:flagellar protein FlaG